MTDEIPSTPGRAWIAETLVGAGWPDVPLSAELVELRSQAGAEPDALFDLARAVRLPALQALAPNTQRAYASDWRSFVRICSQAGLCALPATPPLVQAFIELSAEYSSTVHYQYILPETPRRNLKASTIERALTAIGAVHEWLKFPNPAAHPDVVRTLKTNTYGRSGRQSKAPLSYSVIERALTTYGASLPDLRAKALVTVAFCTMLHRSELVALQVEDFQPTPHQDDGWVRLSQRTTDPAGQRVQRYVSAPARAHLEAWLAAAGITQGPIFTPLNRNGEPLSRALHANEVAGIVKDVARRAGFTEREVRSISAQSIRIGAAQALAESGASLLDLMQEGGWKGPQMPVRYLREVAVSSGAMARWSRARQQPKPSLGDGVRDPGPEINSPTRRSAI